MFGKTGKPKIKAMINAGKKQKLIQKRNISLCMYLIIFLNTHFN